MVGETILHYRVLEKIGSGGMGVVYKAEDVRLGRFVALKFLQTSGSPPDVASTPDSPPDPAALERFRREARAMSALNHPNICTVYDVGDYQGQPFIAMEYLEGETLRSRLAGNLGFAPFRAAEVLDYAIQIASGLDVAHQRGIVHRDIKPTNIFVTADGHVKLLDFGLASLARRDRVREVVSASGAAGQSQAAALRQGSWSHADGASSRDLTVAGTTLGTLFYMSPEQKRGEELDGRSDLYSFGLVLNDMTDSWQSYEGRVAQALPRAEADQVDPALLRELETVTSKALEEDRDARYQTAAEMKADLLRLKRESEARQISSQAGVTRSPGRTRSATYLLAGAGALALALVAAMLYLHFGPAKQVLGPRGSIVLADFVNSTGDSVFTDTLQQALVVALAQSPLLNILSDESARSTLALMERPTGTPLTPAVAREVCRRTSSAAYVSGSIAGLGRQYVLLLKAVGCGNDQTIAASQATALGKENVLAALGAAAADLRRRLGESLASVSKLDVPLDQATTSSLDALEAFSRGRSTYSQKGLAAAVPLFERATQLDPNFAMAYDDLGLAYDNAGENGAAAENLRRAYDLRARTSEHERFHIEAHYNRAATGDLEKARQTYELWKAAYPRDPIAHGDLAVALSMLGLYDRALQENNEARLLEPVEITWAANGVNYEMALGRLADARAACQQAIQQRIDSDYLHSLAYDLAFLAHDAAGMAQQLAWAKGRSGTEDVLLAAEADTQAYAGRLSRARELSAEAVASAQQAGEPETAAGWMAAAALREALFGQAATARANAVAALNLSKGRDVSAAAGLALALAGDAAGASRVSADLARRLPEDTVVNLNYLPAIRAAVTSDPARAVDTLRAAAPDELGTVTISSMSLNLYPIYVRALAYLRLKQGPEAAAEFQKIISHPGLVINEPIGALAQLGLARALELSGDSAASRAQYKGFLDLWKDADPGIPVLREAREELAQLQ